MTTLQFKKSKSKETKDDKRLQYITSLIDVIHCVEDWEEEEANFEEDLFKLYAMEYKYTLEAKSSIDEYELRCSKCNCVCNNPVNCPQGHDHCRDCIVSCSESEAQNIVVCPTNGCEALLDLKNLHANHVAAKIIDGLKVHCPNRNVDEQDSGGNDRRNSAGANGSGSKRKRNVKFVAPSIATPSKASMEALCAPQSMPRDPGCLWVGSRNALLKHLEDCLYAKVECGFIGCRVQIPRKLLLEHEETCEHGHTKCPKCGEDLINKFESLTLHPNECQQEIVECSHVFCHFMCVRQDIEAHEENQKRHHELLIERLAESNKFITSARVNPEEMNSHKVSIIW